MRFLLDTSICIYCIKQKPRAVLDRLRQLPVSGVGVSAVTVAELEFGVFKSADPARNRAALLAFLSPLEIAAFDDRAAEEYGRIRAHLQARGTPIGPLDLLIAAHGLSLGATLVTNNEREFCRVPGLAVENWAQ
jgi:tRNA(fMet)-specific endonuclease VapC